MVFTLYQFYQYLPYYSNHSKCTQINFHVSKDCFWCYNSEIQLMSLDMRHVSNFCARNYMYHFRHFLTNFWPISTHFYHFWPISTNFDQFLTNFDHFFLIFDQFLINFWSIFENFKRESEPSYNTRLIATDGAGQHVETEVVINVQDVNDNAPVFEKSNPTVQYSDSSPPGSLVAR